MIISWSVFFVFISLTGERKLNDRNFISIPELALKNKEVTVQKYLLGIVRKKPIIGLHNL